MFSCNDNYRQDDTDINIVNDNMNFNSNMNMDGEFQQAIGDVMSPVIEPGRERVVNRTFVHEVPHICPINTRIINNHVYKHTYQPRYTCCEENTCTNVQCGSCCCFK
ncbi:MAG: CotD family spore coat protein [Bacilli bacterium]|nr:CotD family spore coat protein [Bacilli bacterium]